MKVLVTGSTGFIGKHLVLALKNAGYEVYEYSSTVGNLEEATKDCEFVFHFAGVTRPENEDYSSNYTVLNELLDNLEKNNNKSPIMLASSIWAVTPHPYGVSKKLAEDILTAYGEEHDIKTYAYRLCNVFGPGARYNYCSVVATWCHNLSHNIECKIDDPNKDITLLYIDDLVDSLLTLLKTGETVVPHIVTLTLGDLYSQLIQIRDSVNNGYMLEIGTDSGDEFISKLYSTYLYYIGYPIIGKEMHEDNRGSFTELMRSKETGQVSINIIKPGVTKGGHYHFSKWEQFIVVKGYCKITETNIFTGQEKTYSADEVEIKSLYMKPMHMHWITNIGTTDAVVVIYANECYDPNDPDTFVLK